MKQYNNQIFLATCIMVVYQAIRRSFCSVTPPVVIKFNKSVSYDDPAIFNNKCIQVRCYFLFSRELLFKPKWWRVCCLIFSNFSETFDCVNHQLLDQKLDVYGSRRTSFTYLQSLVTETTHHYVKNEKSLSQLECRMVRYFILYMVFVNWWSYSFLE